MNRTVTIAFAAAYLALIAPNASAQPKKRGSERFEDVVTQVNTKFEPASAKPGDIVTWTVSFRVADGWHTYPSSQGVPDSSQITEISAPEDGSLELVGMPKESGKTATKLEDNQQLTYLEGSVSFEQRFRVTEMAGNGPLLIDVPVRVIVCRESNCLPQKTLDSPAALTVTGGTALPPKVKPIVETKPPTGNNDYRAIMEDIAERLQKQKAPEYTGLWQFLLTAMFWGGVSLLTPCVFPMIPITVSFFLKQSEKKHGSAMVSALVYCGTIVVVLGAASLTLLSVFTEWAISPIMNLFLGTLFIVLALSLFGMFDLTLPASLTRFTSSREGQGGLIGTVFMALTFTVVSFTCVAPFLGGFSAVASGGQFKWWELALGALAFSGTFAFPFFLLALFPSLMRKLPKSGGWLHTVKVVMGFVEVAAGLKFFRTAELIALSEPVLFTYDLVMAMWVVLCIVCGMYLLRLLHVGDDEIEIRGISVPRLMFSLAFLSLGIYLLPALFAGSKPGTNHRPHGSVFAWIDSFLLPDASPSGLIWTADLKQAIDDARGDRQRTGKPAFLFIDFTGESCTNCRYNERHVFTRGDVQELFKKYRLVQLYTDKVPNALYPAEVRSQLHGVSRQRADGSVNAWFQEKCFSDTRLPLYVILEPKPDGSVAVFEMYPESKINNIDNFVEFLKRPFRGT